VLVAARDDLVARAEAQARDDAADPVGRARGQRDVTGGGAQPGRVGGAQLVAQLAQAAEVLRTSAPVALALELLARRGDGRGGDGTVGAGVQIGDARERGKGGTEIGGLDARRG
jgi:hypothetical protein